MTVDGTVTGLQFLELTDSPGFGLKANDPTFTLPNGQTFYGQFNGKNAEQDLKPELTLTQFQVQQLQAMLLPT